jgi:tRNA G37 N-methylase TrmD
VYSPFKVGLAGGISGIGLTILTILFSANPFVLAGGTLARLGMIGAISSVISGLIAKYGSLYKYNKYRSQLKD